MFTSLLQLLRLIPASLSGPHVTNSVCNARREAHMPYFAICNTGANSQEEDVEEEEEREEEGRGGRGATFVAAIVGIIAALLVVALFVVLAIAGLRRWRKR